MGQLQCLLQPRHKSSMEGKSHIIDRALQLASEGLQIDQIKRQLSLEGYVDIDEHLSGKQIRDEMSRRRKSGR
jgi:hypothetical protein